MKELPILYSTAMVQALLANRKKQTRRIFKDHPRLGSDLTNVDLKQWMGDHPEYILSFCPYGKPGDLLWVRESFSYYEPDGYGFNYKADFEDTKVGKWKPSIHMPKEAARIWLQVIDVRVERLQDISEADAIAEGVFEYEDGTFKNYFSQKGLRPQDGVECLLAKGSFQSLWCSINGLFSWNINPWVWIIEFNVLSTTGRGYIAQDLLLQLDGKELTI